MIGIYKLDIVLDIACQPFVYIGQSKNCGRRLREHLCNCVNGAKNENPSLLDLWQNGACFGMTILEQCSEEELDGKEKSYISAAKIEFGDRCINLLDGGNKPPSQKGKPKSPEHRAKIAASNRGKKRSKETCDNIKRAKSDISDETRRRQSLAQKSSEKCRTRRLSRKGCKMTDEQKQRLSEATKLSFVNGRVNGFFGKKHSQESKTKMREAR